MAENDVKTTSDAIKEVANNADNLSKLTNTEVDKTAVKTQCGGAANGDTCSCCAPDIVRVKNLMSTVTINMENAECCCPEDLGAPASNAD